MTPSDHDILVRMDTQVGEMHKWCFGNGRPGADERLTTLETQFAEHKKPRQWPAVAAAICAIVMAAYTITTGNTKIRIVKEMAEQQQTEGR